MLYEVTPAFEEFLHSNPGKPTPQLHELNAATQILSSKGEGSLRSYVAEHYPGSKVHVYAVKEDDGLINPPLVEDSPRGVIAVQRVQTGKDEHYLALLRAIKPQPPEGVQVSILGRELYISIPVPPLIMGFLFSTFFAWLLSRYFASPIDKLRLAFISLAGGKLNTRIESCNGKKEWRII